MEKKLYNLGIPLSTLHFFLTVIIATIVLGGVLYLINPSFLPVALLIPFGILFSIEYLYNRKVTSIREELPRFIHFLSTHPHITLKDVIKFGSEGFGELSREMKGLLVLVERGSHPSRVLRAFAKRYDDPEIERIIDGLLAAFRAGNVSRYLKNLSEELYFTHELENERKGALSLQRYSIAFSSAVLVPFILGLVVSMVTKLGGTEGAPLHLIPPYLILLSLISGSFLGLTEGKPKNAPFYILITAVISLTVYWVVSWLY